MKGVPKFKKPVVVMFYSYKGGTGRTTSAANVASLLAYKCEPPSKVLVIDLDFDGPGMSLVLGTEKEQSFALQDYLIGKRKYIGPDGWIQDVALVRAKHGLSVGDFNNKGSLLLLSSRIGYEDAIDIREEESVRFENLISLLQQDISLDLDYIILDGASGYSDAATLGLRMADYVFVMMRLSYQHVVGSISIVQFIRMTTELRPNMDFIPAAMVIPPTLTSDEIALREYYIGLIRENFGKSPIEVNEIHTLKWEERVLLYDQDENMRLLSNSYGPMVNIIEDYRIKTRS